MVTGAGGSIGFELCKQINNFSPKKLILFEQNEYHLYQATEKLKSYTKIKSVLGDVRDEKKYLKYYLTHLHLYLLNNCKYHLI